jgi:hypothetical protein
MSLDSDAWHPFAQTLFSLDGCGAIRRRLPWRFCAPIKISRRRRGVYNRGTQSEKEQDDKAQFDFHGFVGAVQKIFGHVARL